MTEGFPSENAPKRASTGTLSETVVTSLDNAIEDFSLFDHERLGLALESAQIATWDFDPIHGELVWDVRCRALFGLSEDAPVNYEVFLAGVHPDDRSLMHDRIVQALNPAGSGEFEQDYRTVGFSDGVERWVASKGKAFFDDARTRAVRFIGIARDVTAQKRAQQEREEAILAMKSSELRLRLALDAARMGSWEWDVRTNELVWAGHVEEIHGLAPGTFDGRFETFVSLIHEDDRDQVLASIAEALASHDTFRTEYRVPFPDGTIHWVAGEGLVERDITRAPICMLGMAWDITRAKWGEEAAQRVGLRERRIAERLQEALRPTLPGTVPGLKLAEHYRAAMDEAEIGGDFYDVFALEKGCYALVVADLSGKGLLAASQIATVRHMLRALLYERYTSLAQSVTTLNAMLAEHDLLTGFATLFVGAYDVNDRSIHYVSCGQEPGILRRAATGAVELLGPTGPILGAFSVARYEERKVILEPGDVLALFTDGLTEAGLSRRDMLGVPGVVAALEGSVTGDPSPEEITSRIMAAIEEKATADGLRDDICLLVGKVE